MRSLTSAVLLLLSVSSADAAPDWRRTLAERREKRLLALREYAELGWFPHNHGHEGRREPYFMDRHGHLCAVGFLMARSRPGFDYARFKQEKQSAVKHSGMGVVVNDRPATREPRPPLEDVLGFINELATTNNHVRIADVEDGPVLEWILTSGLTQEEAALIQPGYSYLSCDVCVPGSEASPKSFGRPTGASIAEQAREKARVRAHLRAVEAKLRADTRKSLGLAYDRLMRRGAADVSRRRRLSR